MTCVRVPATTANVGPGFDSLGIALQLYNHVEVSLTKAPRIALSGDFQREQSRGAIKMAMGAARSFFRKTEIEECGLTMRIEGDVPIARGLGSSVTVRLGVVAGLNRLFGSPLKQDAVLDLVAILEGHPDNAAPALYGGFVVSGMVGEKTVCIRNKLSKTLKFVAAIPDFEVETKKARALLPASLPFADAVYNVSRAALLVAALCSRDYKAVGDFLDDRLHQPFRAALVPQLFPALNAAKRAGALGGWLSGSGPTVMALTLVKPEKVGQAMQKAFEDSGVSCRIVTMEADHQGIVFDN